ncbi:MAG TPA: rod shape-determining protein MreD [Lachnospiraceae bacterium]|nr:rod shape-determining protein MreD [Lachnospiraceae bacterium]HAL32369.1 rod shape-determining protein MreD [Lachnospiraceae bacterium]HBB59635.1 rod shape-determining protein MreD [Lachnospiraceae bacterium]HCR99355.1 rod shape-determining protein MreD [Lachnospiraceae bacterium]
MRKLIELLAVFVAFLLQSTLFQHLSFAGIVPNMMIIVTCICGFMSGKNDGMIAGFICGLLMDVFYGDVLGFNALVYLYIGYTSGSVNRLFYPEDIKLPLIFISVADLSYLFITYLIRFMLRARFNIGYYFINVMLPELVYTFAVTLILYFPLSRITMKLGGFERENE